MENITKTHILVIPYPSQGHMIPILDLIHHLAATDHLTITVVTTPKNLPLFSPLISAHPTTVTPLVLSFPAIPDIPAAVENAKDLPPLAFRPMMFALSRLQDPLLRWFESHPSPPVAIISDLFLGWTHRFATKLGIKRVVYSPSSGLGTSVIYSLWRDMPKGDGTDVILFRELPNSPKYPWWQLSTVYRSYVEGEAVSEFIKEGFEENMASWGLVINSFDELEMDNFRHLMSQLGHDRVWAVGPLVPSEEKVGRARLRDRGGSSSGEADEILSWLDMCRDNEVVYVSFGTQAALTNSQMEALAEGLEKSGVRFIWCISAAVPQEGEEDHGLVPPGFEDRVSGRGRVVKGWIPQVLILRHRAVGVMVTHCGWNSVLEGLMAGVEMLAWPMWADNFSNCTLVVDQLKVGVRICEGPKAVPNSVELARLLAESVSRDEEQRQKITNLCNAALDAISENGTSFQELARLVKSLIELNKS